MFGIIVGVVIAVWTIFVSGNSMEVGFLSATDFLWGWYWIWTAVFGVLMLVIALIITGSLTFAGADNFRSKVGGFLGFAAGGVLSILILACVAVSRGLLLGGRVPPQDFGDGRDDLRRVRYDQADVWGDSAPSRPDHVQFLGKFFVRQMLSRTL